MFFIYIYEHIGAFFSNAWNVWTPQPDTGYFRSHVTLQTWLYTSVLLAFTCMLCTRQAKLLPKLRMHLIPIPLTDDTCRNPPTPLWRRRRAYWGANSHTKCSITFANLAVSISALAGGGAINGFAPRPELGGVCEISRRFWGVWA